MSAMRALLPTDEPQWPDPDPTLPPHAPMTKAQRAQAGVGLRAHPELERLIAGFLSRARAILSDPAHWGGDAELADCAAQLLDDSPKTRFVQAVLRRSRAVQSEVKRPADDAPAHQPA